MEKVTVGDKMRWRADMRKLLFLSHSGTEMYFDVAVLISATG